MNRHILDEEYLVNEKELPFITPKLQSKIRYLSIISLIVAIFILCFFAVVVLIIEKEGNIDKIMRSTPFLIGFLSMLPSAFLAFKIYESTQVFITSSKNTITLERIFHHIFWFWASMGIGALAILVLLIEEFLR